MDKGEFSGGPVVKKPPSNAADMDSIPVLETKISHAEGQLNLCGCNYWARGPQLESPRATAVELSALDHN